MEPTTQAAPEAPATIKDLATGFLDDLDRNTDPNQMEPHPAPVEEVEASEGETPEEAEEQEAEEATPEAPEIPMVEVELEDGSKVNIPENIKPHVMRDKDYRQKTMALAEERKAYEQLTATAQHLATQAQQLAPHLAQLHAMDNRANQLHAALQSPQLADDPIEFNKTQGELAILLRNRDQFAYGLNQMQSAFQQQQTQLRLERMNLEAPKLFEEIPDFAKQETRENLGKYVREQGLSDEEFDYLNFSVPGSRLAWKAMQYDRMVKDQAETRKKLSAKVTNTPVAAQSNRAAPAAAQDKKLREQWRKGGGKIHDESFSALLRSKFRT